MSASKRDCPWKIVVKAGHAAFRSLFGIGKNYADSSDFYCEVQPGELRFFFASYSAAFLFVVYCKRKSLDISFQDERKPGVTRNLDEVLRREKDYALMEKKVPEARTYPMRLELAGYYADDAADFLRRYRVTFYSKDFDFQGVKSRRAKAYVDLRMALEATLKAAISLRSPFALSGKPLVDKVRSYSHRIDKLTRDALKGIRVDARYLTAMEKCDIAPVDLRYQFDAMTFRTPDDRTYYETIGSDAWLETLERFIDIGVKRLKAALGRRSKIISGTVLMAELDRPSDYPNHK
jgi:hypothetical protein